MKVDVSASSTTTGKKTQSATNLHHSSTANLTKPVTRSQSKIDTKPSSHHEFTKPSTLITTRNPSTRQPTRSASSLTESKRPTHNTIPTEVGVKKSQSTNGLKKPTTQVSKTTLTAPPQPVHNSTYHDLAIDDLTSKIDTIVTISTSTSTNKSLIQAQVAQKPVLPKIEVTSPKEKEEEKVIESNVKSRSRNPSPRVKTPAKIEKQEVPVIDSEYFERIELDKRDVAYYKSLLEFKTRMLNGFCDEWEAGCGEAPEDIQGDGRSACGLAKLLIDERFNQFADLIRQCESSQLNPESMFAFFKLNKH